MERDAYGYARSPPYSASNMNPDIASPIYPERSIRPLPKSRLKSRLSPEQVSSIVYPPNPPPISPTLNLRSIEHAAQVTTNGDGHERHFHGHEPASMHDHCSCQHAEGDSGDEEVEFDHPDYRYATQPSPNNTANGKVHDSVQRRLMEASKVNNDGRGPSATSSADGYESFENTSNKKKRKIPLSTLSATHQTRLSAELANMGICHDEEEEEDTDLATTSATGAPYDVSSQGVAGTGISGAGRGRYGRREIKDARRPLASTTINTPNGYAGHVSSRRDMDSKEAMSPTGQTPGIISRALRTAAEAGPLTPQKGKENVSLLRQNTSTGASPKTQFTFTCESDSANKLLEQQPLAQQDAYREKMAAQSYANGQRGVSNPRGTEASHQMRAPQPPAHQQMPPPAPVQSQQHQKPAPRPRRSPSKEYALAARQRKMQQQYSNYHHRPRPEDMWICQFCEYEDIFGVPPVALIRSYEIKDRQERKKAAEKRRLLEKAKQRGRKGKKGSKSANNKHTGTAAPAPAHSQQYDQHGAPIDDDYFDDDADSFEDEYDPVGPDDEGEYDTGEYYEQPPPVPMSTPQPLPPTARAGG